jgi:antitoxin (DNA-binding transcriptional repressor) of toxin-antitoxin stability system
VKVTATELANDSKKVLDHVIKRGEDAEIQRHGKTVVRIRRQVGVSREELLRKLGKIDFTRDERQELKRAMDAASDVFGYAGRD